MNLAGTEFNVDTGIFDIFVSGCNIKCPDCFNPEAQDFNFGEKLDSTSLVNKIKENEQLIKSIRIMGGDLLSQDEKRALLLAFSLKWSFNFITLILYTGEEEKNIPNWCYEYFDQIIYGKYIKELKCENPLYGSSNQKIIYKGIDY